MVNDDCWEEIKRFAGLTDREFQVTQLIFNGGSRNSTAESLGITERTVRHHLETLYNKLCVKNRVDLVLRIIQIRDQLEELQKQE